MGRMSRVKSVGQEAKSAPTRPGWPQNFTNRWTPFGEIRVTRLAIKLRNCITPLYCYESALRILRQVRYVQNQKYTEPNSQEQA